MAENNPVYVGYYPGERPLMKKPYVPPAEYAENDLLGIDEFFDYAEQPFGIPNWFYERLKADFKASLSARVLPPGTVTAETLELFGAEGSDDLPRAFGISVSLNPQKWLSDPLGQAWSTVQSWGEAALDWDDFDAQRSQLLMSGKGGVLSDPLRKKDLMANYNPATMTPAEIMDANQYVLPTGLDKSVLDHQTKMVLAGQNSLPRSGYKSPNPLSLDNLGVFKEEKIVGKYNGFKTTRTYDVDVYSQVKEKVGYFQLQKRNIFGREEAYDNLMKSMGTALNEDIRQQASSYVGRSFGTGRNAMEFGYEAPDIAILEDYFRSAADTGAIKVPKSMTRDAFVRAATDQAVAFDTKTRLAGLVGKSSGSMNGVSKKLDAFNATSHPGGLKKLIKNGTENKKTGVITGGSIPSIDAAKKQRADLAQVRKNLAGNPYEKRANKLLRNYERSLDKFISLEGDIRKVAEGKVTGAQRTALATSLKESIDSIQNETIFSRGLTKGQIFVGKSTQRQFIRDFEADIRFDDLGIFSGGTVGGKKMRAILPFVSRQNVAGGVEEWFRAESGKGIINTYVWTKIKNRIEVYTPAYWTTKTLTRFHHFGLVVNEREGLVDAEKGVKMGIGRFAVHFSGGENAPGKLFGNHFDMKFDDDNFFSDYKLIMDKGSYDFSKLSGRNLKFFGGDHFDAVGTLGDFHAKGLLNENATRLLLMTDEKTLAGIKFNDRFVTTMLRSRNGNPLPFQNEGEWIAFRNDLVKYKTYLRKNAKAIGLTDADLKDSDTMYQLYQAMYLRGLDPNRLDITRRFVGALERVSEKLNIFQNKLFHKNRFAKPILNVVFKWKTLLTGTTTQALTRVVEAAVTKLIILLGGTIGAGIGGIIFSAISPIINAVVKKVVDFGQAMVKGVIKGDVGAVFDAFDKSMNKSIQMGLYILSIPILIALVFIMFIFNPLTGGNSNTNPAIVGGGGEWVADVPTTSPTAYNSLTTCPEESVEPTSCVYNSPVNIMRTSYARSDRGHGTPNYWSGIASVGYTACSFALPMNVGGEAPYAWGPGESGRFGTADCGPYYDPVNYPEVSYYGNSLDVQTLASCGTLYLPQPTGASEDLVWNSGTSWGSSRGDGHVIIGYEGGEQRYRMHILHVVGATSGSNMRPGDRFAETYDWGSNHHAHVEFYTWNGDGWVSEIPEDYVGC